MPSLHDLLTRARSLYGAGLGFASLGLLSSIVRATIGLRWEDDGAMADILAVIDADIGQAIQASLACPLYTLLDLIDHFPEFERRDRRWWRCWFYVGTRSEEWFTMCCERQYGWCEFLGRRISVWKSSSEYWILEILIITSRVLPTCRILFTLVIYKYVHSNLTHRDLLTWRTGKKKPKTSCGAIYNCLKETFLTSWSKTFSRLQYPHSG